MLIDIYMKFHEDSLNSFQVIEWHKYDRQPDRSLGEWGSGGGGTICIPTVKWGDIIIMIINRMHYTACSQFYRVHVLKI